MVSLLLSHQGSPTNCYKIYLFVKWWNNLELVVMDAQLYNYSKKERSILSKLGPLFLAIFLSLIIFNRYNSLLYSLTSASWYTNTRICIYIFSNMHIYKIYLYDTLHYFFNLMTSVQFSHSVVSDSLWPHESQHARPPCPSPTPRVHSDSRPLSQWCHPAISSSVVPFSSCPQSLSASESFPMS